MGIVTMAQRLYIGRKSMVINHVSRLFNMEVFLTN